MDTQNSVSGVQGQSGPVVTPSVLVHCPPAQSQCYFLKEAVNPASRHSRRTTIHRPSFIIHLLPVVQKCPVHQSPAFLPYGLAGCHKQDRKG